jgi:hypothetical protein
MPVCCVVQVMQAGYHPMDACRAAVDVVLKHYPKAFIALVCANVQVGCISMRGAVTARCFVRDGCYIRLIFLYCPVITCTQNVHCLEIYFSVKKRILSSQARQKAPLVGATQACVILKLYLSKMYAGTK